MEENKLEVPLKKIRKIFGLWWNEVTEPIGICLFKSNAERHNL
jgi:hypothetical protein